MGVQQNLYPSYYNIFDREYKKDGLFAYKKNQNTSHIRVLQKSTVITIRTLDIVRYIICQTFRAKQLKFGLQMVQMSIAHAATVTP